ncbi:MAG TPA: hypothetical protein VIU61_05935 [Kofleriaceae bacterium]
MGVDRARVLGLALAAIALCVASMFVMDWFQIGDSIAINLRHLRVCPRSGVCATLDFGKVKGVYPFLSNVTLWGSVLFAALVAFQAGCRLIQGHASEGINRIGYIVGLAMLVTAGATGYVFGPDVGSADLGALGGTVSVVRTWAPAALLLGHVLGIATLYFAIQQETGSVAMQPAIPVAVVKPASQPGRQLTPGPFRQLTPPGPIPRIIPEQRSQPIAFPERVKGKLRFAALTAELTRGGVDARREDGTALLVIWRDVVGVVARRLPPDLEGDTFVDLVSTAGSTIRITPWTRLTGEPMEGEGEVRARSVVNLVLAQCAAVKLDRATREFVDGKPAAQLPDAAMLAQHDDRLA